MKNILVLAPHTDDGELGCGGTIAKLIDEGNKVYYAAFSTCEKSIPEGLAKNTLQVELMEATTELGIDSKDVRIFNYPVREFPAYRQDILDDMIAMGRELLPDIVFCPSIHDIHQDHHVIAEEAMRAFKKTTLLSYEVPWNNFTFDNQMYVALDEKYVEKKICAIACYKSQKDRIYTDRMFTEGQLRVHGVQIGCQYAEVFETVRWIIK